MNNIYIVKVISYITDLSGKNESVKILQVKRGMKKQAQITKTVYDQNLVPKTSPLRINQSYIIK